MIKTPSNAYRLPFIQALFPSARIRILHLVRNPAASINGLIEVGAFVVFMRIGFLKHWLFLNIWTEDQGMRNGGNMTWLPGGKNEPM